MHQPPDLIPDPILDKRIAGLRSLVKAVKANPGIADLPDKHLAVFGGPEQLAATIDAAIGAQPAETWEQLIAVLDWPTFLLQVREYAAQILNSLIESERVVDSSTQWVHGRLQPQLDLEVKG